MSGLVMNNSAARYRLGVDVGGTHTDLVLLDTATGQLLVEKVSSTPKNPALGVLNGVAKFIARGIAPGTIEFFAHGTTITTNALLEMRGAKVGLLITAGYRAVQEVQTQARDGNLFDYFYAKPQPIAPQSLTREIPERSDYAGNVLLPLDRDAVRRAARELKAAGVEFDRGVLPVLVHEPGARGRDPRPHPARNSQACTCRSRARCCHASANGRGSPPRCSTPTSSR